MSMSTASQILGYLSPILNGDSSDARAIAFSAAQATQQFKANQISAGEYQEIIGDLQAEQVVNLTAAEAALKTELTTIFSMVASASSLLPI